MAPFIFIDRVSRGLSLPQYGNGSSSRDYTYIDDIVDGVVRSIDRPYMYQVLNLGKGSGTQLSDFIQLVEKYVKRKANIEYLDDQPGDVPYTCANVTKANNLLGYESHTKFEEGIAQTVKWYKQAYPLGDEKKKKQSSDEPSTEEGEKRDTNQRRLLSLPMPVSRPRKDTRRRFLRQLQEIDRVAQDFDASWRNETVLDPHTGPKKVLVTGAAGFSKKTCVGHQDAIGNFCTSISPVLCKCTSWKPRSRRTIGTRRYSCSG